MALDFPANPVNGQVYDSYTYNSAVGAWQAREDTATVAIMSAVAPTSASNGDLWVNTNDGTSFVYYEDGNSSQWVEILAAGSSALQQEAGATAIPLTVNTASATAAKVSDETVTFEDGNIYIVKFVLGTSVNDPTLNGVNIQLGTTNANTTVLSVGVNAVIPMLYNATTNKLQLFGSQRTSDSVEDATMRWSNTIQVGAETTQYKILMEAPNGKFYPLSVGNSTAANAKTIASTQFLLSGSIITYYTTATLAADATTSFIYSEVTMGTNFAYTANQVASWANYKAVYLKGTVNASGNFVLAGAGTTGTDFMTQTLPTTADGFVYMLLGYMYSTTTSFRLIAQHPIYEYVNGVLRAYVPKTIDLGELYDVNAPSPTDGNALVYDTATSKWVPNQDTDAIKMNAQTISANYTIPTGYNGMSAGPITIASGVTVTIPSGSSWSIV